MSDSGPEVEARGEWNDRYHKRRWPRRPGTYREVHGEAIDLWPLLVQLLRAFVGADREFHAWRRQAGGSASRTPPWSEDGTGMESRNG